jgi:hypothetical protein
MTEQEIFFLSPEASSDFSFARAWTRIAVNTAARRFALRSNPERIRCHRRAFGTHLFCPALSTPALHARTGVTRTFTVAPLRTKLEYHRHDATRCVGRTIAQDMRSGILQTSKRDALGIMRSCMPGSLLHTAASNAPHTAITRTRFENAHGLHIAQTEVTLGRENKMKNE